MANNRSLRGSETKGRRRRIRSPGGENMVGVAGSLNAV
jgi:hypothetical protein